MKQKLIILQGEIDESTIRIHSWRPQHPSIKNGWIQIFSYPPPQVARG